MSTMTSKRAHKGFSLIEVLASSVILAIGLLGLASLHFENLKKSNDNFHKTMATFAAGDMIERMRANLDAVNQGYYDSASSGSITLGNNTNCLGGVENGGRLQDDFEVIYETVCNADGTVCESIQNYVQSTANLSNTRCNTQEIALQDIYEWQDNVASTLPNGQASVCRTSSPGTEGETLKCDGKGNLVAMRVTWTGKDGKTKEYRLSFKP